MLDLRQLYIGDEALVEEYLEQRELETLELTGRYEKYGLGNDHMNKKAGDWFGVFTESNLTGLFQFSNHHSMLCHFEDFEILKKVVLLKTIRYYSPRNITGVKTCIDPIYQLIAKSLKDVRYAECWQMVGIQDSFITVGLKAGMRFEDAIHYDLNRAVDFLIEAEKAFGRKPRMVNDLKMRITDREEQEIYLFLMDQEKVAAQGAIEFHTHRYAQIAGVYTAQALRSKGYAHLLMQELMRRIGQRGLKPSLVVEKRNHPAVKLYEKLGFEKGPSCVALNLEMD